jgi:DNA-binding LytR/AlgR family response regulator
MKILIIEDETQAAQRLEKLVREIYPSADIVGKFDTVKKSVQWFKTNPAPDLALMDIQLADGISFQIFEQVEVQCPVIFTTAFDEYALKAFKVNSIDYILKPVAKDELQAAFKKWESHRGSKVETQQMLDNIGQALQMLSKKYKTRFVIKVGEHLRTIEVDTIRYFFSQDKTTFCVTEDNRNFILDFTLEQLEEMLNPEEYFRINRKYLIRSSSLQDIVSFSNSRLKLVLKGSQDNDIIVARERVQDFKSWLDR